MPENISCKPFVQGKAPFPHHLVLVVLLIGTPSPLPTFRNTSIQLHSTLSKEQPIMAHLPHPDLSRSSDVMQQIPERPHLTTMAQPRDSVYWTQHISTLKLPRTPTGALNLNVDGRHVLSPHQGFGQLWQKTFRIQLKSQRVTAGEVIKTWKEHFPKFWPTGEHFYAPSTGIGSGETVLINMLIPSDHSIGFPISTGVFVFSTDERSFTFLTAQGHMFAGWITFRAYEEEGVTLAQIQMLLRASDPLYELGFRLGANKYETLFWQYTLTALAAHFGVHEPIQTQIVCVDPKVQWSQFWNLWQNAAIRTLLYRMTRLVPRMCKWAHTRAANA
jgi:hypothetical protein